MCKQHSQVNLASTLLEDSGDYSGEPTFQGGPLGFGGRQQLANPVTAPGLQDPAEEKYYPVMPSLYPVLFAQERDPVAQLDEYTRARGDVLYKDLPGGPAINTLDKPVDHVPHGEDPEGKLDTDAYGVQHLIPNGRDDIDPGEQYMVDDLDDSSVNGLKLDKANIMASPNDYAVTSPEYRGKNIKNPPSVVFDQLVKPVDWIGMETGTDQPYLPGEINDQDFESRVMQAGNIVKPVVWVGNGDNRNNNNMDKPYLKPDYYLSEIMPAAKKETSNTAQPATTKPKPTGNGLGTVQSRFDNFPKKGKSDVTEPFSDKTVEGDMSTSSKISDSNGTTTANSWNISNLSADQVEVLQEKVVRSVLAKLQKLNRA